MRRQAVILTALELEYKSVLAHLSDIEELKHPRGNIYDKGKFDSGDQEWDVLVVQTGKGNSPAGMYAERAIDFFEPSVILFVGVAGGLKDVALGDVVVADKIYNYGSGKATEDFLPRPALDQPTFEIMERAKAEARNTHWRRRIVDPAAGNSPTVWTGPIAAGEAVIASTKSSLFLFLSTNYGDALAVDMEGYGVLEAARVNPGVSALVVRGISDLIDGKTHTDNAGWQDIAAKNASAFAFEVLSKLYSRKDKGGRESVESVFAYNPESSTKSENEPPLPSLPAEGLYLSRFTVNGKKDTGLNDSKENKLDVWVKSVGSKEVYLTGVELKIIYFQSDVEAYWETGRLSGAIQRDADYVFDYNYTHELDPQLIVVPSDLDPLNFQVTLRPEDGSNNSDDFRTASIHYNYADGTKGVLPLEQVPPEFELLAYISNRTIPVSLRSYSGIFGVAPNGQLKGSALSKLDGDTPQPLELDQSYLTSRYYLNSLINAIEHPNAKIRALAAKSLGIIGNPLALDALFRALNDSSHVVKEVLLALQRINNKSWAYSFPFLTYGAPLLPLQTIDIALRAMNNERSVRKVTPLLKDRRSWIRQWACQTLGKLKNPVAIPFLLESLVKENQGSPPSRKTLLIIDKESYLLDEHEKWNELMENCIDDSVYRQWTLGPGFQRRKSEVQSSTVENQVNLSAADALIEIGDKSICGTVASLSSHESVLVRTAAKHVLDKLKASQ